MAASLTRVRRSRPATAKLSFQGSVFNDLAARKGALNDVQRAELCNIDRSTLSRIKGNQIVPNLDLAMHIAETVGTPVEKLWIRQAA